MPLIRMRLLLVVTILLVMIILLFVSCIKERPNTKQMDFVMEGNSSYGNKATTIIIDSCEYVFVPFNNASWGSHKGNCKNPIHKCK